MASNASVPVTMLSGFLGAGKTTLLRELLSQSKYRVGCIVNDVAAVNIDAKLVRNQTAKQGAAFSRTTSDLAPTIELDNGCACCSVQEELFMSFEQMLAVSDRSKIPFDRIVLENSGVAEPQNIREAFAQAMEVGHPVVSRVHLSTMITVVDSHTFIQEFACRNPVATRPDLGGDQSLFRPVVDLLVEQIEVADYVLLNKVDMLGEERVPELEAIIRSINPLCQVVSCSHGQVDMDRLFGPDAQSLLANLNTEGQHRGYIAASSKAKEHAAAGKDGDKAHGHSHDHAHGHEKKPKHAHDHDKEHDHDHDHKHEHGHHHHDHDHGKEHKHDHDHGHDHKHGHGHGHHHHHDHGDGKEHKHDHGHDHAHGHGKDKHGRDHHDHHHGHNHGPGEECGHDHGPTTAETRFGITSFVYERRVPFHPQRLREVVLKWMPVSHNKAVDTPAADPAENKSPMRAVMRSKGFAWMAHGHANAFYWSHAGQHFEMREEGDWWAAVPEDEWPMEPEKRAIVFSDFVPEFGDRRQEIVFIGAGMDKPSIEAALDQCLLTPEELEKYISNWSKLPDPPHPGAPTSTPAA